MSTVVKSTDPCPLCLIQNKVVNHLQNRPGQFETTCAGGHKFPDTGELNILRQQAMAKYPNVYAGLAPQPPTPTDPALLASTDIVITAEMKATIEEIAGVKLTGAADVKGLIFAYVQDNLDKDSELKSLRGKAAQSGRATIAGGLRPITLRPDQLIVTVPEWAMEGGIESQAEHAGTTPEEWVNQQFEAWMEQFFSGQLARGRG